MKITLTGSMGNINQTLIPVLVRAGHQVSVISHNEEKKKLIEKAGALPLIGSVKDPGFLGTAFEGAEAVYTMTPPDFGATDLRGYMRTVGKNYAAAIANGGVRRVVNLSSVGAHLEGGPGPTGVNHEVEGLFNGLSATEVIHLRPGMFYTNFFGSMETIRNQGILGNNFNGSIPMLLSHPQDIATAAARALTAPVDQGRQVRYVISDEKTGVEIAAILGKAISKPELTWVNVPDEALKQGLLQAGLSEQMATIYVVEIGIALREGLLFEDYRRHPNAVEGKTRFEEFAMEFAYVYHRS